jgi:FixJ family two-component response regulator
MRPGPRQAWRRDRGCAGTDLRAAAPPPALVTTGDGRLNGAPIIAIVDDDASVRRSLLRVVQSAGYTGETFASAREFIAWLAHGQAACLVLDIHMDEMNGFDLYDRLNVPTVFITAHDDAATLERIKSSGAAGHLRKPFDRPTVLETIRRVVGARDDEPSANMPDNEEGGES